MLVAPRIVTNVSYVTKINMVWSCFDAKLVAVDGLARVQF